MISIIIPGAFILLLLWNLHSNWPIIAAILNRDLKIYTITLNILEDHKGTLWAKENKQRVEWINSYSGSITFLPGIFIRFKPILLEKWHPEDAVLTRIDQRYRSKSDESFRLNITRECRFITYHNRLQNADMQYTQIKALVFDCSTAAP